MEGRMNVWINDAGKINYPDALKFKHEKQNYEIVASNIEKHLNDFQVGKDYLNNI